MIVKIKKRESAKARENKIKKASAKAKKINWDKYFGKINFPVNGIAYQQKMRDEWQ